MKTASLTEFGLAPIFDQTTNAKTSLASLWKEKPAVLLFLRRLGCAICRAYVKEMEARRKELEDLGARVVALSFERFGEGSDVDRSFEKGGFWTGEMYSIDKDIYAELFERKGLMNGFYGLLDIDKKLRDKIKVHGVSGNLKGDGFQLGGQFVVSINGDVIFEHRQKKYGDDADFEDLETAVRLATV